MWISLRLGSGRNPTDLHLGRVTGSSMAPAPVTHFCYVRVSCSPVSQPPSCHSPLHGRPLSCYRGRDPPRRGNRHTLAHQAIRSSTLPTEQADAACHERGDIHHDPFTTHTQSTDAHT